VSRLRRDESGANAVEFALLLPVLIILLFGVISVGLLYNQQLSLTQAAREGARFAATLPDAPVGECGVDAGADYGSGTWCTRVRDRTINASNGLLTEDDVDTISHEDQDGEVRVAVSREGTLDIIMTPPWRPTLTAESIARYEHTTLPDET
jgi:Flp pilus assembly pilin Flp